MTFADDDPYVDMPLFELPEGYCLVCGRQVEQVDDDYCEEHWPEE